MKAKEKEKTRSKNKNKNVYIYLAVAIAIAIIGFSAIEQVVNPARQKVAAADYFKSDGGIPVELDETRPNTDQVLYLLQFQFNLTAVGGDANHMVISVPASVPTDEWPYIEGLKQNTTLVVTLPTFQADYLVRKNADGYFVFVTSIDCDEATGRITILFK